MTESLSPASTTVNIAYRERQRLNAEAKRRIARAVARAVPGDRSLFLGIGTTAEACARELLHHRGLRVITNNLHIASILSANARCEVVVAGGLLRPRDCTVVGEATVDFLRRFRVDIGLIGISAIEPDGTLRDFDHQEVTVSRAIVDQSREVWLVADHTKFSRRAMVEVARLEQIDALFTDAEPPPPFPELLAEARVRVQQ